MQHGGAGAEHWALLTSLNFSPYYAKQAEPFCKGMPLVMARFKSLIAEREAWALFVALQFL